MACRSRLPVLALTFGGALALAGCSSKPDETPGGDATQAATRAASAPGPEVTASNPVAPDTELADTHSIPPLLRGRWGLVAADCTSQRGDAKGLMTVGPARLQFYESVADLGRIESIAADAVTAAFAFEGEGQSWDLDVTLATPDGGKTLVRTDRGADAAPGPLTYTKCA